MLALIRAIHAELKGAYGSPRMVRELRARGFSASKERVERLMRDNGKNERVHGIRYATHAEIKATAFEYIEVFYNRKRQHSTLGYKSPTQFLAAWLSRQHQEKLVA